MGFRPGLRGFRIVAKITLQNYWETLWTAEGSIARVQAKRTLARLVRDEFGLEPKDLLGVKFGVDCFGSDPADLADSDLFAQEDSGEYIAIQVAAKLAESVARVWTRRDVWNLACDHDGIERGSKFVVFSKDNPWHKALNRGLWGMQADLMQTQIGRG